MTFCLVLIRYRPQSYQHPLLVQKKSKTQTQSLFAREKGDDEKLKCTNKIWVNIDALSKFPTFKVYAIADGEQREKVS